MVCFHHAGASAAVFRNWADVHHSCEIAAVQLPGRGERFRESPVHSWPEIVDGVVGALMSMPYQPTVLFGCSLGALLAYEVACELQLRVHSWTLELIVAASRCPDAARVEDPVASGPERKLLARLRSYGGMAEEILQNAELMALLMPTLRADFALSENYHFDPQRRPLECPITAVGGRSDKWVSEEHIKRWAALTNAHFSWSMIEGGHFLLQESHEAVIAIARSVIAKLAGRTAESAHSM
ncbi:MAG TPA: alpha/beta fold hydrolase [Steroidobacteraceae bacterium]|nr:alpha/beta fold hydrolase [Steroidobacteraceae bacterium]